MREKTREWKRHVTSHNHISQQVILSIVNYSSRREGFVKEIFFFLFLLGDFLELLRGTHIMRCESLEPENIVRTSLTMLSCFREAFYDIGLPLNVLGKCGVKQIVVFSAVFCPESKSLLLKLVSIPVQAHSSFMQVLPTVRIFLLFSLSPFHLSLFFLYSINMYQYFLFIQYCARYGKKL